MSGDVNNNGGSWLSKVNLPQLLAGRAGEAVSKIIGAPIEVLSARIDRVRANVEARTEGQVEFQKIVAAAAAKEAIEDSEFVSRAIVTYGRDLIKKQKNKEEVVKLALENLSNEDNSSAREFGEVDEDWLNNFSAYTEKVSNKQVQKLWGKILAGEIRGPGSYSLSTLRLLSVVDQRLGEVITTYLNHDVGGSLIMKRNLKGDTANSIDPELLELESLGILSGVSSELFKPLNVTNGVINVLYEEKNALLSIQVKSGITTLQIPAIKLSQVGVELLSLLPLMSPLELAQHLKLFLKGKFDKIEVFFIPNQNALSQGVKIGEVLP